MRGRRCRAAGSLLALAAALGCGAPPPESPSAVVQISPSAVCEGDAYRTLVHLDGSQSTPRLSLVPAPPEPGDPALAYAWSLSGSAHVVAGGTLDAPELWVLLEGDRPLHAALTVRDALGGEATTLATLAITATGEASDACPGEP